MRPIRIIPAVLLFTAASLAASQIREFSIPTLERLGNELSHRDHIAAEAEDLVMTKYPQFKSVSPRGWVSERGREGDVVYLVSDTQSGCAAAYKVTFLKGVAPRIEDMHGQSLPPAIMTRCKARQTAIAAMLPKLNGAYGAHYNIEVLSDPDGSGFLVYALAASNKPGEQFIGGHVRVTVSADGSKAERVDELSAGIIRHERPPRGSEALLSSLYDPANKVPVETYIYSSNLYHLPIYVGTNDRSIWVVDKGKIEKLKEKLDETAPTSKTQKKK